MLSFAIFVPAGIRLLVQLDLLLTQCSNFKFLNLSLRFLCMQIFFFFTLADTLGGCTKKVTPLDLVMKRAR